MLRLKQALARFICLGYSSLRRSLRVARMVSVERGHRLVDVCFLS